MSFRLGYLDFHIKRSQVDIVTRRLQGKVHGIESNAFVGVRNALDVIKKRALPLTPYKTGRLYRSIYTQGHRMAGVIEGEVGYTAPYALLVHERTLHYRKPGTGPKFLARALRPHKFVLAAIAGPIRRDLR